uniref:Endoplasmic reticulum oxidoreductin-1 n=1 Tax=Rhizophora mucronata TaxID=61149 RepID=A0A2P2J687_RHIMU
MASEKEKESGKERKDWRWVGIGAIVALVIAVALTSTAAPKISLFGSSNKSCSCSQKYSGMVEDCCCDYETVNHLNEEVLHPNLQELVKTPFFRYFKVVYNLFVFS